MKTRPSVLFCLALILALSWLGAGHTVACQTPTNVPAPAPDSDNLALGQPVVVSSVLRPGFEGEKAVDGDLDSRWASQRGDPQWIHVQPRLGLMGPPIITDVVLRWAKAYGAGYHLQVSDDAAHWITIYTETAGDGGDDVIDGLYATGRYMRLYGFQQVNNRGYSLYEFELYGAEAPAGDLGWRVVGGVVYANLAAPGHELAGALVECSQFSYFPRDGSCSPYQVTTGPDGKFAFDVFVHDTDQITISAERTGYQPDSETLSGFQCVGACPPVTLVLTSATPTPTPTPPPPVEIP